MTYSRDLVQDFDSGLFDQRHVGLGATARGFDIGNALLGDKLEHLFGLFARDSMGQHGNIDPKRHTLAKITAFLNFIAQLIKIRKAGCSNKAQNRSEEHTSELQSRFDLVCRLLLEK